MILVKKTIGLIVIGMIMIGTMMMVITVITVVLIPKMKMMSGDVSNNESDSYKQG